MRRKRILNIASAELAKTEAKSNAVKISDRSKTSEERGENSLFLLYNNYRKEAFMFIVEKVNVGDVVSNPCSVSGRFERVKELKKVDAETLYYDNGGPDHWINKTAVVFQEMEGDLWAVYIHDGTYWLIRRSSEKLESDY